MSKVFVYAFIQRLNKLITQNVVGTTKKTEKLFR